MSTSIDPADRYSISGREDILESDRQIGKRGAIVVGCLHVLVAAGDGHVEGVVTDKIGSEKVPGGRGISLISELLEELPNFRLEFVHGCSSLRSNWPVCLCSASDATCLLPSSTRPQPPIEWTQADLPENVR